MELTKKCPECQGSGVQYLYSGISLDKFTEVPCPVCGGKKFVVVDTERLVKI